MKKFALLVFCLFATQAHAFQTLFIVRHAEKQDDSKDPALSLKGQSRALDLASLLKDAGIKAIYATEYQRTQKTAEPLAGLLSLKIQPTDKDLKAFANQLLADKSSDAALVVGHSNTVPEIVKALGLSVNWTIADQEFDRLTIITLSKSTAVLTTLRY